MTKVSILPIANQSGELSYHAVADDKYANGRTAGEALDALTAQFGETETDTLVIVQSQKGDAFFSQAQKERLGELMALWRNARDSGETLPPAEQQELEQLIEAELQATSQRTAAILTELNTP